MWVERHCELLTHLEAANDPSMVAVCIHDVGDGSVHLGDWIWKPGENEPALRIYASASYLAGWWVTPIFPAPQWVVDRARDFVARKEQARKEAADRDTPTGNALAPIRRTQQRYEIPTPWTLVDKQKKEQT